MTPFVAFEALAVPLDQSNVDTDQIIPAEFLRQPRASGFSRFLFHRRRFSSDGSENQDFVLNWPRYRQARILVADANFGCGSSRESAVWALMDAADDPSAPGRFRAIIAPSFGDIFYNNASKNGLLCVRLGAVECETIRRELREGSRGRIRVDLESQFVVGPGGTRYLFEIDPFRKECLLRGVSDIELTMSHGASISAWEERQRRERPWALLGQWETGQ